VEQSKTDLKELCVLVVKQSLFSNRDDIGPGQEVKVKLSFKPTRAGLRKLMVDFDADRIRDVKGIATLIVRNK
jgi:hypothetical protein